ncbi:MAG: YbhB/YbcL family Raf kinase inhibitor-like protein [Halanaerobiales bacterium]|nr:YbhB/YbcL family Raf kinase inhibitor-like protein [Halanaerobiales bacterium]
MDNNLKIISDFESEGQIPEKYTADGEDISPPLKIDNIKERAETIAIVVDDPDAPMAGPFTHWLIWNIPASINNISKGIPAKGEVKKLEAAIQGQNDFGEPGYRGPAPPGGTHTYRFQVYTLDKKINLEAGANKEKLLEKMKDHILQKGLLRGKYSR